MSLTAVESVLENCKKIGIRNILALRGDIPKEGETITHCTHAIDLIKLIKVWFFCINLLTKDKYGDYFMIGVAGFPEKHEESPTWETELYYLKQKVCF